MTGNGTQASPYIPANWAELKTAAETADAYIRLPAETQWDMNEQYPENAPGISLRCYEIDFNGAVIKNLRKSSAILFYHAAEHNVTMKNGVFSSMYITSATIFNAVGYYDTYSIKLFNMGFGGELYDSELWLCDGRGVDADCCAFNFYLSNSNVTNNEKPLTNTIISIDGTVNDDIGVLNLVSSALYGEVRAVNAQKLLVFYGELSVVDITLQNFSAVRYTGDKTTVVLNVEKVGGATVSGSTLIQATSAQMKDAAWLNSHGFPCA